jgi:integron integrase
VGAAPPKLLDRVRHIIRLKHYSPSTERNHLYWIRPFILFHNKRHPRTLGKSHLEAFLTHLAIDAKVAAATQNQALNAMLFLYKHVLDETFDFPLDAVRAKRPKRLPTALSQEEVRKPLECMSGTWRLMPNLVYGSGLCLVECARLSVKDLDLSGLQIIVRDTTGSRDRATILPHSMISPLQAHLKRTFRLHQSDLSSGHGAVFLPHALAARCPHAEKLWIWQYIFPSYKLSHDPNSNRLRRHPIHPGAFAKQSDAPPSWHAFHSTVRPTHFATVSAPTCSKPAMTSAPPRISSAITYLIVMSDLFEPSGRTWRSNMDYSSCHSATQEISLDPKRADVPHLITEYVPLNLVSLMKVASAEKSVSRFADPTNSPSGLNEIEPNSSFGIS